MTTKTNGVGPSPDDIRQHGLEAASELRALAKQVKDTATTLDAEIEEVAEAAIEAFCDVASRVEAFKQNCVDIRKTLKDHRITITELPAAPQLATPADEQHVQRLEQALDLKIGN